MVLDGVGCVTLSKRGCISRAYPLTSFFFFFFPPDTPSLPFAPLLNHTPSRALCFLSCSALLEECAQMPLLMKCQKLPTTNA